MQGGRSGRGEQVIYEEANPTAEVTIGMVGKYVSLPDAYKSVNEALKHGGLKTRLSVNIKYIDSQDIETRGAELLEGLDAILVPGGFGERGVEGKIQAAQYAREKDPLPGYLPRHAGCHDRIRPQRGRHGRAHSSEFKRIVPIRWWVSSPSGWMTKATSRLVPRSPIWAVPCVWVPSSATWSKVQGTPDVRQPDHLRAPPSPL